MMTDHAPREVRPAADEEMGRRGRNAFLALHEKDHCCSEWASMIGELLAEPSNRNPAPHPRRVGASIAH